LLEQAARLLYKEWFVHLRFPGHEHTPIIDCMPEGWEKKRLGDVATTNAVSYKANNLPSEINYIDISSVKQGRMLSKCKIPSSEAPGRARRKGADGDVIWSNVRPNLRAYALILEPEENDVFSTGFTILSPTAIPFSYLYLFVTTDEFVGHLVNHTTGASYPAVRPDDFERAEILLPTQSVLNIFHEMMEPAFRMIQVLEKEINALAQARDLLLPKLMNGEVAV
jgi:type I restriction enzyme S subunit